MRYHTSICQIKMYNLAHVFSERIDELTRVLIYVCCTQFRKINSDVTD